MIFGKHINKYYLKYAIPMILGVIALLYVDYVQVEIPRIFAGIIDKLRESTLTNTILNESVLRLVWIVLIMVVGRVLWRVFVFGSARFIEHDLRMSMFLHAEALGVDFYKEHKVGGLMTHFINDLEAIRQAFGPGILMLFDSLFLGTIVIIRMTQLSREMTLIAVIPLALMGVVAMFIIKKMRMKYKLRQDSFEHMSDFTQESFSGINVIRAFVKEVKEAVFFAEKNDDFYKKHVDFVKTMILINIVITVFINLTILTIIAYGAWIAITSDFTPGMLTEYFTLFTTLIWPVMALSQFASIRSQAVASYKRIQTFMGAKVSVKDEKNVKPNQTLSGRITFKHLDFAYPDDPERQILNDISVSIEKGEMVGVLGRTGSGKSTFVDLLLRLYNVKSDALYLDDHDIMSLSIHNVRDQIAYVPQDNFLFSDTILNNIGFSEPSMPEEKASYYARLADVHDNIIDFTHGYQTEIGERGVTLSGGQKQRISIARALAKDAPILILDDSVSAVDTKTEESIIKHLEEIRQGKTTIVIAHRISTIRKMDKIILLDQGHLLDVGSHEDLLKRNALYQEMVRKQELEHMVEG
ncbi:ABC transporter ATP-binding protein/permease [Acholeplasma manati]|uniref:ABC transporter ATP-binding protein/permease n=1 Tax=Paracholeplasma manati TaxID=591373 RepID=A0ABT2Y5Q4_9MOLU|nr:ABC transporter ATP-binding protein [Paracholeplasma manati]MCV2231778.1 ABC transporter ATP-binding protein/permease [Paracholeplasma manati]